jgi:hypothetical protein
MADTPFLFQTLLQAEPVRDTNKEAIGDSPMASSKKSHGDLKVTDGFLSGRSGQGLRVTPVKTKIEEIKAEKTFHSRLLEQIKHIDTELSRGV